MANCVDDCLIQWVKRARGMHTPTWQEWGEDTVIDLREYRQRRTEAIRLVEGAQFALLDHDLATIRENLRTLKGLL